MQLGIGSSHSRPGVSDDNAHIEAWFRTCKYAPSYPAKGFETIAQARAWTLQFVTWYNGTHLHSALAYVTPEQRHTGVANAVLARRRDVLPPLSNVIRCAGNAIYGLGWHRMRSGLTRHRNRPNVWLLNQVMRQLS